MQFITGGGVKLGAAVAHEQEAHPKRQVAVQAVLQPLAVGQHHPFGDLRGGGGGKERVITGMKIR